MSDIFRIMCLQFFLFSDLFVTLWLSDTIFGRKKGLFPYSFSSAFGVGVCLPHMRIAARHGRAVFRARGQRLFLTRLNRCPIMYRPTAAPNNTPTASAAKSSHSPLRQSVRVACIISISPPINTGSTTATMNRRIPRMVLRQR